MAELRPHVDEIEKLGVSLAVIGNGAPNFLRGFVEELHLPPSLSIFTDEKRVSYKAAGWKRGTPISQAWKSVGKGIVSHFKHPQKKVMGDAFQLGGVAIIRPDGTMPWHFGSAYAGDHAPLATVIAEVKKAVA